jgi:hypothetical protein
MRSSRGTCRESRWQHLLRSFLRLAAPTVRSSLETADEDGNCVQVEGKTYDTTNCIRLHIPYAFLGKRPERDYFPTCFAIADHLGWSVYDEQSGEDIPRDAIASDTTQPQKPWWRFW